MDDPATKGVLLDSIEIHREHLLSKEEQRIYSFRKGKSPATEQDEEREAQLEKQLKDLADNYKSISENKATAKQRKRTRGATSDSTSLVSPEKWPLVAQTNVILESLESSSEDEEPIWNPLTSSYAHRETGFEPGPSKSRYGSDTPESIENGYHGRLETPVGVWLGSKDFYVQEEMLSSHFRQQNHRPRRSAIPHQALHLTPSAPQVPATVTLKEMIA